MPSTALKAQFHVRAGVLPGVPEDKLSKQWLYTVADYEADRELPPMPEGHTIDMNGPLDQPHMSRFTRIHMEAMRYYSGLVSPSRLNWAELGWLWL